MLPESEVVFRMIAAVLVGLLIGVARRGKGAGVRTFSLIALGCTMFTLASIHDMFGFQTDQTRILGQIVSGIGFLGLGVIWKQGDKPTGLTTAAAIWVSAAIGIMVGLGLWTEVVAGTVLTVLLLFSKKTLTRAGME